MAAETAARSRATPLGLRQRSIQLGLVAVGLALVHVADAVAESLLVIDPGPSSQRLAALLLTGGRVLAGWGAGLAFRLQLAPDARSDEQLRGLLGVPLGFISAWPIVLGLLPAPARGLLPAALREGGPVLAVQPVAAVLLGLVVALAVSRRTGRR